MATHKSMTIHHFVSRERRRHRRFYSRRLAPGVVKGAARLRQASAAATAGGSRTGECRMPQPLRRPIQGIMASLQRLRSRRRANAWRGIKLPGATS